MKKGRVMLGMRKLVSGMLARCTVESLKYFPPFAVCEMSHQIPSGRVIWGVGVARLGDGDLFSAEIGERIARLRAVTAIVYKLQNRTIHHPLMG